MTTSNGQQKVVTPEVVGKFFDMVANVTMMRSSMLQRLFDPRRNIDDECGYPPMEAGTSSSSSINPELFRSLYDRENIPARVVEVLPKESWQVTPTVYEDENPDNVTEFEDAWDELGQSLRGEQSWYQDEAGSPVWKALMTADVLSGIGSFGILLLGIDDGRPLDVPADGVSTTDPYEAGGNPTSGGSNGDTEPQTNVLAHCRLPGKPRGASYYDLISNQWSVPTKLVETRPTYGTGTNGLPVCNGSTETKDLQLDSVQANLIAEGVPAEQVTNDFLPGFGTTGMGTDEQYLGVQLGPSEYPSSVPSSERRRLLFLRAYDESLVQIVQYESNARNPRFGQPVMYRVTLNDPRDTQSGIGMPLATVRVHWSRVIHLADDHHQASPSKVLAPPRMRPVLNRLLDLRKLYSASAEGYWKSCFTGLSIETVPQLGGDVEIDEENVRQMVENYQNGLQRFLGLMGMTAKTLSPMVVDPASQINVQIEAICIKLGMPIRIFKGSERGELASSQDDESWNERKRERQVMYVTPCIIIPFVDRCISLGILPEPGRGKKKPDPALKSWAPKKPAAPAEGGDEGGGKAGGGGNGFGGGKPFGGGRPAFGGKSVTTSAVRGPDHRGRYRVEDRRGFTLIVNAQGKPVGVETKGGYSIEWPDLESLNKKDKAAIALQRVQALGGYVGTNVETIMAPMDFLTREMGYTEEEATAIIENVMAVHKDEETMTIPPQIAGRTAAPPEGTAEFEQAKMKQDQFDKMVEVKKAVAQKGANPFQAGEADGAEGEAPVPPPRKGKGPPVRNRASQNRISPVEAELELRLAME